MRASSPGCDPVRLQSLLGNTLEDDEQDHLIAHLDTCADCQRTLEGLAAGRRWWEELHLIEARDSRVSRRGDDESGRESESETLDDTPALDTPLDFLATSSEAGALGRLGIYEVVEVIGRGGFGLVLKAIDPTLNRTVAIKVLVPTLATIGTARRRFAREARAVAAIAHEHIVAIHAVDSTGGLPYIVMQYVPGRSLQDRIDQNGPLGLKEILRIGAQTASGLAAAHAQGLIHRDIKPSNILLENCVERVKITDFGLARAVDDASVTQSGTVAGTPQYMAPEQARGDALDPRTDLFSLGSVLYAMCTGHSPFRAETTMAVLRRVCDDRPRPIQEINPDVPEWLEAIVERLHAKDPADRFATADEVAGVLGRCLAHVQDPTRFALPEIPFRTQARALAPPDHDFRRPSGKDKAKGAKIRTFPRAIAAAVLLAAGALGTAEATGLKGAVAELVATVLRIPTHDGTLVVEVEDPGVSVRIDNESDEVTITGAGVHEIRLKPGQHQVKAVKDGKPVMSELVSISRGGKQVVRVILEPVVAGGTTPAGVMKAADMAAARPAATAMPGGKPEGEVTRFVDRTAGGSQPLPTILSLALSHDGRRVATGHPSELRIWDVATRRELAHEDAPGLTISTLAFSHDGTLIATADRKGNDHQIALRDGATGKVIRSMLGDQSSVTGMRFSPDGREIAAAGRGKTVRIWDVASGAERRTLSGHEAEVTIVAYSPDGKTLASSSLDRTARLWDAATGEPKGVLRGHQEGVQRIIFAPDGKTVATSSYDLTIKLWDVADGRELATLSGHEAPVLAIAFSPDGQTLVSAASPWGPKFGYAPQSSELRFWDVAGRKSLDAFKGPPTQVFELLFLPDGKTLVSSGLDKTMRLWDVATRKPAGTMPPAPGSSPSAEPDAVLLAVAYSPDGRTIATAGEDKLITLRDAATREPVKTLAGHTDIVAGLAFSPDGKTLASASFDRTARLWDVANGKERASLQGHTNWVFAVAFSPDGETLATASYDKTARLWDVANGKDLNVLTGHTATVRALAFAPDGKSLATGGGDRAIRVWDLESFATRSTLKGHKGTIRALAYSPDGNTLASASEDATVRLWDSASGQTRATLEGHTDMVTCLAFSPTGRTLFTASWDQSVRLWDVARGKERAKLTGHSDGISALAIAPGGQALATVGVDKALKVWEADSPVLSAASSFDNLKDEVWSIAYSPDGRTMVIAGKAPEILLWDVSGRRGRALSAPQGTKSVAFSPDGRLFATGGHDRTAKLWDAASGERLATLEGHSDAVFSVVFSPDGKLLATGAGTGPSSSGTWNRGMKCDRWRNRSCRSPAWRSRPTARPLPR